MDHSQLAKKVYETCHLTGNFKLRSGKISNEYFDKYRLESNPNLLNTIAEHLKKMIPPETEVLAGLEMGGIPIATALSLKTGIPICFVRKSPKTYGTCQFAEGIDVKGKNICIIEDVITSGGQVILSTHDLRALGAIINHVVCVIHRGDHETDKKLLAIGLKNHHLFTRSDFPN
jgi:orotate phosphoribosyltransferase